MLSLAALLFTFFTASSQEAYRTVNTTPGTVMQWTNASTWQRFDGSTWVNATNFPTAADGIITIRTGDTIQLNTAAPISIDQVVIEPNAVLVIFNSVAGNTTTVTLNDGVGDDIIVNGRMYLATAGTLTGAGNVQVNSGALFTLRNTGNLQVPLTNDGTMHLGAASQAAGTITNTTVTNNGTVVWINGNGALANNATFTNNGTIYHASASSSNWNTTGTNNLINNGTLINQTNTTWTIFPTFTNAGTMGGSGTYAFNAGTTNFISNTGTFSPGASAGTLTVPPLSITGKTPSIDIELFSTGGAQGTNYDHLIITGAVNITGATLNVTNTADDPVGTTYTIVTSSGTITGPFAAVNKPTNFDITYNTNSIVLSKTAMSPLPVAWGTFNAVSSNGKVVLDWSTLMEENASHFVIEHATDPTNFTPVAQVQAKGNSTYEAKYQYVFTTPDLTKTNFFRIKQVDFDGKSSYSATRSVKFDKGTVVAIQAYPNPVKDVLQLNVQRENIQVMLVDQSGRTLQQRTVQPGQHSIDMQSLPNGVYQLAIFEKGVRIETKQIMKQ